MGSRGGGHGGGSIAARERLLRLVPREGRWASMSCRGESAIACWDLPTSSSFDVEGGVAWQGHREGSFEEPGSLRGGFASVALRDGGLVLMRGRVDGRALYYAHTRGAFVACTRLLTLLALLDDVPVPNARWLASIAMSRRAGDLCETSYAGIARVLPGEILTVTPHGRVIRSRLPLPQLDRLAGEPEEIARALRAEVEAAVTRAIAGKKRIAVKAGGGVDSSALLATTVAIARGANRREVDAIALDFAGAGDDRPHLRSLVGALGIVPIRVKPAQCGKHARRGMVLEGAPFVPPTLAWNIEMARLAREAGADVMLSGEGGDDVFDGNPRLFAAHAWRGNVVGAVVRAARLRVPWRASAVQRVGDFVGRPIAARLAPKALRRWWRASRKRLVPWAGHRVAGLLADAIEQPSPIDFVPRTPAAAFASLAGAAHLLDAADLRGQLEADTQLDHEDPYLDERLVRFVARIPPALMLHDDRLRGLLRLAYRDLLPETLRLRTDKARFEPAFREMFDAIGGLASFRDLATPTALGALGIVEPERFRAEFDGIVASDAIEEFCGVCWPVLALEAFLRSEPGLKRVSA